MRCYETYHKPEAVLQIDVSDAPETAEEPLDVLFSHLIRESPHVDATHTHDEVALTSALACTCTHYSTRAEIDAVIVA